jgi:hypothetical protein
MGLSLSLSLLHQFCSFLLSTEFPHISQNFLISELICHILLKALYSINTLYMTQKVHLLITLLTLFFVCFFSSVCFFFFFGVFQKMNLLFFLCAGARARGYITKEYKTIFFCPAKKTEFESNLLNYIIMESCNSIQGKSNEPKNAIKTQT